MTLKCCLAVKNMKTCDGHLEITDEFLEAKGVCAAFKAVNELVVSSHETLVTLKEGFST